MLDIKNLSFAYHKEQKVIEDLNLHIASGEFVAIAGRNGSGKTTLTRLIMGLEKPSSGEIFFQGDNITKVPVAKRGSYIGYVFQQPERQMFRNTVEDEISFGDKQLGMSDEEVKTVVAEVMAKVNISEYAKEYPLNLRRGLKQRIAIASVLAMKSNVIILDEPTSGQDSKETYELLQILKDLNDAGITIILITHNMDIIAEYCSRAILMSAGKIVFDGNSEQLFTECENLYELGLVKPISVELGEAMGLGYCANMDILKERILNKGGYHG